MGPPGVSHTFVQTLDLCHTTVKHLMSSRYTSATPQAVPTGPGDILELIRHGRATTRGDVLELTGLSRMTVAQRLDALLARRDDRRGRDRRGDRRAAPAQPGASTPPSRGCWRQPSTPPTRGSRSPTWAAPCWATPRSTSRSRPDRRWCSTRSRRRWRSLLEKHDLAPSDLCGAGISLPGPIDPVSGRPSQPPILPGWDAYPVAEHLQADAARRPGAHRERRRRGGAGGVRRRPRRRPRAVPGQGAPRASAPASSSTGGSTPGRTAAPATSATSGSRQRSDALCQCGMQGCLAAVASGRAVAARAHRARATRPPRGTRCASCLRAGNADAARLTQQAGRRIGEVMATVVCLLNPEVRR